MNLIETLTEQTQSLKDQYIAKTKEYAADDFKRIERLAGSMPRSYESFATPGFVKGPGFSSIDYEQGKQYRKAADRLHKARMIVKNGYEAFEAREVKMAERHYTDSIIKLAARIIKKDLAQTNLSIKTSHIGVNIETTFTDGVRNVRAWTIIASGPCVRPHYRYLVK